MITCLPSASICFLLLIFQTPRFRQRSNFPASLCGQHSQYQLAAKHQLYLLQKLNLSDNEQNKGMTSDFLMTKLCSMCGGAQSGMLLVRTLCTVLTKKGRNENHPSSKTASSV